MKKLILSATVIAGFATAKAQTNNSQQVTLNITLNQVQTIAVNNTPIVNLEYVNESDYANGVTSKVDNHLRITSTGGFEVKVKSSNLQNSDKSKTIEASSVLLTARKSTNTANEIGGTVTYMQSTGLSNQDQILVKSDLGGIGKEISVDYTGGKEYINKHSNSTTPSKTVYSTQVTYTIIAA
ncbi:MAG: hypothetical protein KBS61_07580 [Chryseobacterium sp.]|nr:hypothetical protein [Candidatus Chryseobacterium enterohippi]